MATDDRQIFVAGTANAPAQFLIPGNGQVRPKAVYATFDGTGAAVAFLPILEVFSDAGELVGRYKAESTVAAGASADVSWFPGVKPAAGAAPAAAPLPYAYAFRNNWTWPQPGSTFADFTGGTFFTSDPAVIVTNSSATVPLQVQTAGIYLVEIGVGEWQPAWGNVARIDLAGIVSWKYNTDASTLKRSQMAPTYAPTVGSHPYLSTTIISVVDVGTTPIDYRIQALQQSGVNRNVNVQMFVVRLSTL